MGLKGPHYDGDDFAEEAMARGAIGAVVSKPVQVPADRWALIVPDTYQALTQWAAWRRRHFTGTVIAVTGSVGKTTTRQMIHTVLQSRFTGTASPRNYNNHIGVPLSMTQLDPTHDYAVLELGASRRGEIASLAELCAPKVGAITHIGDATWGCSAGVMRSPRPRPVAGRLAARRSCDPGRRSLVASHGPLLPGHAHLGWTRGRMRPDAD